MISLHDSTTLYLRPLRHHADSFASRRVPDTVERFNVAFSACLVVELSHLARPLQRVRWRHSAHLSVPCRWRCYQVRRTPQRQSCARSAPCPVVPCRGPTAAPRETSKGATQPVSWRCAAHFSLSSKRVRTCRRRRTRPASRLVLLVGDQSLGKSCRLDVTSAMPEHRARGVLFGLDALAGSDAPTAPTLQRGG